MKFNYEKYLEISFAKPSPNNTSIFTPNSTIGKIRHFNLQFREFFSLENAMLALSSR